MTFATGRVIHKLLAPPASEVTFLRRGFHAGEPQARDYLEQIGCWFLTGLEYGMTGPGEREVAARLETVPWEYRGFAYEGASMALTILDGLLPAPGRRLGRFIAGPAAHQVYTAHVGAGWAMARLPRPLRSRIRLRDPLLRWLALDGYGFHEAYFHTPPVVAEHRPPGRLPGWPGNATHVVDQGIGRALWFVCGADADRLAGTIAGFAPSRQPDLWAGAGLAATYAGYRSMASLAGLADPPGPQDDTRRQQPAGPALSGPAVSGTALSGTALSGTALSGTALSGTALPSTGAPATAVSGTGASGTAGTPAGRPPGGTGAQAIEASLRELAGHAGRYLPDVAQGAAFAAKARYLAGLVSPHTVIAVRVLCGMEVAEAARCTDEALPAGAPAADAYQTWRHRIRQRFTTTGK